MNRAFFDAWNDIMEGIEQDELDADHPRHVVAAEHFFMWEDGFGSDLDAPQPQQPEATALEERTSAALADFHDLMTASAPDTAEPVSCAACGSAHMKNGRIICNDCKEEFPTDQGETD